MEIRHEPIPAMNIVKNRKKRFAPKTRSGCLICRARRIKCDEAQPSCRRCLKANHVCQYASDKLTQSSTKQSQRDVRVLQAAGTQTDFSLLRSLLPNYGSPEETSYLGKFLTVSAPWLSRYNDGSFFYVVLPQRSWHHPALRHILVAISMATEHARCPLDSRTSKQHRWHHSQALRYIYTAQTTEEGEELVLLTSAMMWLHDNIMYNSRTAVVHLQGFLRILTDHRMKRQQRGLPATEFESQLLRGLVFHADVSDNAFTQVRDCDIIHSIRQRLLDSKYKERFPTMNGVCDELRLGLTAIPYSSRTSTGNDKLGLDSGDCNDSSSITTTELRTYFEKWYRTFNAIPKSTPTDHIMLECHYICAAMALQVHQIGSNPLSPTPVDDQQSLERMEHIMNRLEAIDPVDLQQKPSKKDIELPITQILAQMLSLTNSGDIRTRVYSYLRRIKRVEGLWCSDMIADMMWVSHPPDGSRGPPVSFGSFNPPLKKPLPQSLETWQALDQEDSTANGLAPSYVLEDNSLMVDGYDSVDVDFAAIDTPFHVPGLGAGSTSQAESANDELDTVTSRASSTSSSALNVQLDGEHTKDLLKGGVLITDMFLSQTTWTRNVNQQWREIEAEEHTASKGRGHAYNTAYVQMDSIQ